MAPSFLGSSADNNYNYEDVDEDGKMIMMMII